MNHIYMLGLITNRGMRERFLHFFREYHIEVTFAALGRGTAGSALLDYLGMEDTEKAVYFAVITRDTWQELKKALYARMRIDIPGWHISTFARLFYSSMLPEWAFFFMLNPRCFLEQRQ